MPFRTRDFTLFLLVVAFLIVGIGSTISQDLRVKNTASVVHFEDSNEETKSYKAVLPEEYTDERPSRLATLKEKVADFLESKGEELAIATEEVKESNVEESNDDSNTKKNSILLCSNYTTNNISWAHSKLKFEIVEGARIAYREIPITTTNPVTTTREVLLQLPLRTTPLSFESCLKTDVVGIALDGSLIRNNEYSVYKIFGANTLVGYALDGFPIYGLNETIKTDSCGGAISGGDYKYFISSDREGVVGCFSATPISI